MQRPAFKRIIYSSGSPHGILRNQVDKTNRTNQADQADHAGPADCVQTAISGLRDDNLTGGKEERNAAMFYEMTIAGLKRQLPLCKITDDLYIGAFIMFSDVEITKASAEQLLAKAPEFDVIITAESKGIPLAYEMARQAGTDDYIVARKGPKLYMQNVITTEVDSITTDHIQTLCLGQTEIDKMKGKRILIVDDVISTGESLKSLEVLVNQVGGNIVGKMAVLAEGEAADRDDIIFLEKLPVFNADGSVK